jgi:two-component system sensor histidine kinase TctE
MPIRNSLTARLLLALVLPMSALAIVFGIGGAVVTRQVVDRSADRLLAGVVRAIAETMTVENGEVWVNIPPWALGVLDNPERDRVYYSIRRGTQLLSGYDDLPVTSAAPPDGRTGIPLHDVQGRTHTRSVAQGATGRRRGTGHRHRCAKPRFAPRRAPPADARPAAARSTDDRAPGLPDLAGGALEPAPARCDPPSTATPLDLGAVPSEIRPLLEAFNAVLLDLDRVNESMRRFTADASHQMRTPLAILKTHLSVLEATPHRSADDKASLTDAREAADRLGRLLLQLLALARADNAEGLRIQALDLGEHARAAINAHARIADALGVALHYVPPSQPVCALADAELLGEIVGNLLDNAIRYGGDTVTVRVAASGDSALLQIDDNGAGIPAAQRATVFERFSRLPATQHIPGSGLGLSIVRTLSEKQGGRIELSTSPDGGLRATVSLPAASGPHG